MREERYGGKWDEDDDYYREYGSGKKARRLGTFWKVNKTEISHQSFINIPGQIWRNELSKDEKDFCIT
eukprot:3151245-Ditylum_brightwellii.AAC.1